METYRGSYPPPFPTNSNINSPDFNSYYPGPNDSISAFVLSTFFKRNQLLPWNGIHQSPRAHRFPVEIFSEIFLYAVQDDLHSQTNLMLVCRYWHDIMLSTPGIHSQLRIYGWTKKKDVERFGMRWLLDVTVDTQRYGRSYVDPVEFHACFMAAGEAASRWRSLALLSFPPPGGYQDLQIMHPLQHLESFKLAQSCNLGNFLEPLITAITTTVTSRFTVMEVLNPDAALYIVQPAHFRTFSSLTNLRLTCRRMQNPVDILPSLHKLEILDAHHLSLPIHPTAVDLPLTQTLRNLRLKCVSIQWMAGQIFPALEECTIIFPQDADIFQSVYMPSCSILKYDSNNLGALEHFHCPRLGALEIKCGQCRKWRGDLQLAALHPIFAAQSLTRLRLEIKCSGRLLKYMLGLAPALEELWMGLSSPHALSSAFFLGFTAGGRSASANTSSQTLAPLCRQLKKLHLHYKRWSRGAERNGLIPAFGAIVASYAAEEHVFSFQLSFGEGSELQEWIVHEPVERFDLEWERERTFIGVSSPHGIVPLSTELWDGDNTYPPLPRESEYISTDEELELPIDYFFSFHSLKEVRMTYLNLDMRSNTQSSPDAPIFHELKVLAVWRTQSSPLTSQILYRLERYEDYGDCAMDELRQDRLTEMPICTRLVTTLCRLATLKLPQVRELQVILSDEEPDYLWEKHVAVNARLSGLKLLFLSRSMRKGSLFNDIPKILGSLPDLETLVLNWLHLRNSPVTFFEAFIPMNAQGTSELIWEGQIPEILCPRLESLLIEETESTIQPELMPALRNIVTLRAILGCPLKSFSFCSRAVHNLKMGMNHRKKWELIGRDGSFIMEEVVPAQQFQLVI